MKRSEYNKKTNEFYGEFETLDDLENAADRYEGDPRLPRLADELRELTRAYHHVPELTESQRRMHHAILSYPSSDYTRQQISDAVVSFLDAERERHREANYYAQHHAWRTKLGPALTRAVGEYYANRLVANCEARELAMRGD